MRMWSDLAVPWVAGPPFPSVFKKTEERRLTMLVGGEHGVSQAG